MKFSRIIHSQGSFYYLDGKQLQNGDEVEIRLSDGTLKKGVFMVRFEFDETEYVAYLCINNYGEKLLIEYEDNILLRKLNSSRQRPQYQTTSNLRLSSSQALSE